VLDGFIKQIATLDSIHVEAHVVLRLTQSGVTRGGNGSFSYWEQGDWYRIGASTSKPLGLLSNFDYSFDGEHSRMWFRDSNTVTENTSNDESAPTPFQNPFFLAVGFLIGEDCQGCRMSLDRALQSRVNLSETVDAPDTLTIENSQFGRRFSIVHTNVEGMEVPASIEWLDEEFDADVSIELADWERTNGLLWPMSISMKSVGRSSDLSTTVQYLINTLEVNEEYPKAVFVLGDEESTYIEPVEP